MEHWGIGESEANLSDEERKNVPEIISGLVNPQSHPTLIQWVAQGVEFMKQQLTPPLKDVITGPSLCNQLTGMNEKACQQGRE
jgi:hypothetical protein